MASHRREPHAQGASLRTGTKAERDRYATAITGAEGVRTRLAVKKSQRAGAVEQRHQLVDVHAHTLSRKRQCELLGVARSSSYYKPVTPTAAEQEAEANLARALQALYLQDATLGRRRLPCMLERQHGIRAGYKRIATIRKKLGLRTIFRHPQTTVTANPRKGGKYPYRLRDKKIERIDEVWTSDITYLQIGQKTTISVR